jgi:hypothetical protein
VIKVGFHEMLVSCLFRGETIRHFKKKQVFHSNIRKYI